MAKLTLGDVDYNLAPFKLGMLRRVAPLLDKIKQRTMAETAACAAEGMADVVEVLALALAKEYPAMTVEHLEDDLIGVGDFPAVRAAFFELMQESGMGAAPGEQKPPLTPAGARKNRRASPKG
jgi:hypothetical protein